MVEQAGAGGRATTWRPRALTRPASGGSRGWASPEELARLGRGALQRIRTWVAAEVGPGRLVPWLAIAFGSGIVVYFSVDREPAPWAVAALLAALVVAAILLRSRPFGFSAALGVAAVAAGLAAATIKRAIIEHPV